MNKLNKNDEGKRLRYKVADNIEEACEKVHRILGYSDEELERIVKSGKRQLWDAYKAKFSEELKKHYWEKYSEVTVVEVTQRGRFARVQDQSGLIIEFCFHPKHREYEMVEHPEYFLQEVK